MVVIVDDTVVGEHFDFCRSVRLSLDLKQLPVSLVCRSIHTVDTLNRHLLTIDNVIGFTVFRSCFCDKLKIENIRTAVDCVLNRCAVDEILNQSLFHDNHVVIDSPCALDGHAVVQIATNRLYLTVGLNHQEVVHIFNPNPLNIIDLKLELRFCFPSMSDFVHESQL